MSGFDGGEQSLFAALHQIQNTIDVVKRQPRLGRNRVRVIALLLQNLDPLQEVGCAMLTAGKVFDQAHDECLFFTGIYHDGGDLALPAGRKGFDPPLATDQIILFAVYL